MDVFEVYEKEKPTEAPPEPVKLFEADETPKQAETPRETQTFNIPDDVKNTLIEEIRAQILAEIRGEKGGEDGN